MAEASSMRPSSSSLTAAAGANLVHADKYAKNLWAITGMEVGDAPQKKYFRTRAHCNPLSHSDTFDYPKDPSKMQWRLHFPERFAKTSASSSAPPVPEIADVGCGYGGLLVGLSPLFPESLMVGIEIRDKVSEYVRLRI